MGGGHVGDILAATIGTSALVALGQGDEARAMLREALRMLRERLGAVTDEDFRKTLLERVEEHITILRLARELGVDELV